MGIKDNFSQAVKELWKKDGQEGEVPQTVGTEPSELDRYLREQQNSQGQSAPVQTSATVNQQTEFTPNNVPLETPYYPNANPKPVDNQAAQGGMSSDNQQTSAPNQGMGDAAGRAVNPSANVNSQSMDNGYSQAGRVVAPNMGQGARSDGFSQGYNSQGYNANQGYNNQGYGNGGYGNGGQGGGRFVPPSGNAPSAPMGGEVEETTVISKNTSIEGNIRSLANMTVDGTVKGNVETTRNVDMTGKVVGDVIANNAAMTSAAMQGNVSLKGRMKMDRDTILIGDLSSQYADINGRIRGKLDIVGKAELKRDAIVFGDINASTIAVTDGAIIQGYVNTTFLSKDDSRNVFPDAISIEEQRQAASTNNAANAMPNATATDTTGNPMG